ITTCVPAMASLRPSPVMVLTPLLGEAATTSWPHWRRMETVFEPIRPVPPMTTIFMVSLPSAPEEGQQFGVYLILVRGREAVRRAWIVDFLCAPDEPGRLLRRVLHGNDLVVLPVHD